MTDRDGLVARAMIANRRHFMLAGGSALAGIGALGFSGDAAAAAPAAAAGGVSRIGFAGGAGGEWRVRSQTTLTGESLPKVAGLTVQLNAVPAVPGAVWTLDGVISNLRYTTNQEVAELRRAQAPLARPEAIYASLIPIRKKQAWWDLPQDDRRAIFEERSGHTSIGLRFLPQIARRLHHSRDIGQPFDFLTWFEYAPQHEALFEQLLVELRASEEWTYVDREIDIRLVRSAPAQAVGAKTDL
jgi:hypothetical protein